MKLPIPSFKKKVKTEYFLTLLLRDDKVNASILEEVAGRVQVLAGHEEYFKDSIENAPIEEFLSVLDTAISTAESTLPDQVETQKTIFGVKENWVEGTKIKREYLVKLKKASDSLGLSPIGFLVLHEAISYLLQQEEGAPISCILTEVGKKEIAVSIIRGGKILETKRAHIEESVPKTVDILLHHFTRSEILPSRIIIFNGSKPSIYASDLDHLAQEFTNYSWSKNLPFLHMPKIVALPKGFDAKAVLHGAATQMGFEVLGPLPEPIKDFIPDESKIQKETALHTAIDETLSEKSRKEDENTKDTEAFGFVKDKDFALAAKASEEEIQNDESISNDESLSDDSNTEENDNDPTIHINQEDLVTKNTQISTASILISLKNKTSYFLSKLRTIVKRKNNRVLSSQPIITAQNDGENEEITQQRTHTKKLSFPLNKLFIIPILSIVILISLYEFYLMNLKANITLIMTPTIVKQQKNITISSNGTTDFSIGRIQASEVSVDENGSTSTPATGTKQTGDKAKGSITIYNSDLTASKNIPGGTIIKAPNGLAFTLDSAILVASASGDATSITSSSTNTSITAGDIGKEYNFPSGTKFSVGSYDSSIVLAKNDNAFSGGSKTDETVIAKADFDKLLVDLPKTLADKAKTDITQKATTDSDVLPLFSDITVTKKSFDKIVGDKANQVTLTGTVTFTTFSYRKSDLSDFAKQILTNNLDNKVLSSKGIQTSLDTVSLKDKNASATLQIKALLLPKTDKQKIASSIAGKTLTDSQNILKQLDQVSDATISLHPSIPFLPKRLPGNVNNIIINIQENE